MIKYIFTTILLFLVSVTCIAHRIDGYKYIVITQQGNPYGIEDKLYDTFEQIGFKVIQEGEEADLNGNEMAYVLYAYYSPSIHYGYASELTVVLRDISGADIYRSVTTGNAMRASGDMSNAINKLFKNMKKLNYSFDNSKAIKGISFDVPCRSWSEDSIKTYLKNKPTSSIEGIYKNFSNDGQFYRFAIIKQQDKYYGVIIESGNKNWNKGDIKMSMTYIDKNTYDTEYFNFNRLKINCLASYSNRVLEIATEGGNFKFLKTYPSSNSTDSSSGIVSSDYKAIGSGILISGKIIVTNYHVVEDAEKIEVSLNNNGVSESYKAKLLATDKSNDLALVIIKDENFKELPNAPFKILNSTVDVGSSVFTMGYPLSNLLGDEVKVTDGIISSKSGYEGDVATYQISAPIQPGNSGGALFDKKGNLIGITNAGIPSADNVGYAIKSSYLYNIIDSAPIEISIPEGEDNSNEDLPTLIKKFKPYVAIIKIY